MIELQMRREEAKRPSKPWLPWIEKTAERSYRIIRKTVGEREILSKRAEILTNFLQTFNKVLTTFLLLRFKLFIET
jgi:hypothetical protein